MAATETAEAKELNLVGKVELRIALTDSDSKLESILNTYLPPLLLKLVSDSISVRNKVIAICQHINTRVKAPQIRLPVAALLKQYKENTNPLIRHFDILYIQQGLDRLAVSERLDLLPLLINGIRKNFEESSRHTASIFNLLLRLLHSLTLPPRGSADDINLRQHLGLLDRTEDAQFIASWICRLIAFTPNQSKKRLPALNTEEYDFLQLYDKKDTWLPGAAGGMNLVDTKVVAVKFLASGAFTDTERFLPALFASSDSNSRISDLGDKMLKHAIPAVSLEDQEILNQLFRIYLGTRGIEGSLPARTPLQIKILGLLCKSKRATSYTAQNIQIVKEGLTSGEQVDLSSSATAVQGLEASKLRTQIFVYVNWLARASDSADMNIITSNLIEQLRAYIESQGWPAYGEETTGQDSHRTSLRSLGYESIGVLARANPAMIVLDEQLDLLRWLFNSLAADSAGRDVGLSIEQALSSVLGVFGGDLSKELEGSLEGLLLHNMQRRLGEIEGSDIKIIRSTQFTAVRFANRCLPFKNTKARWMNVLAIGDSTTDRRELLEEGRKGLDPYWYHMLNPAKSETNGGTTLKPFKCEFPRFVDLLGQFFGKDSVWDINQSHHDSLPMMNAYGPAVNFCRSVLLYEGLPPGTLAVNDEWERQLEVLATNDEKVRQTIRDYLNTMAAADKTSKALEKFFQATLNGLLTSDSETAVSCAGCLFQLCSLCPNSIVGGSARHIQVLQGPIMSSNKSLRDISSRIFGILGSHEECPQNVLQKVIGNFIVKNKAWREAVGSQVLQVHGAMLAAAYCWSRRAFRTHVPRPFEYSISFQVLLDSCLEILSSSHDKTLVDAAIASITELSLSGVMAPGSLPPPYSASAMINELVEHAEKGNENAVKALGSFAMQCDEDFAEEADFKLIVAALFNLHKVRDPAIQFAVGEAFGCAAIGWQSKSLVAALDIGGSPPLSTSRNIALSSILDQILEECKSTKPALRQALVIWLLCLVQFCGHLPSIQGRLRDCQIAFKGFLSDRDSLNQETASRGLSLVYEKGDRNLKDDLIRDLVGSFTGSTANMSGTVSGETQLFEPGALPTGDGSITTYKDIMSLAAEVGNPSLVYRFMSLAANNAIWSSRAAFGRFGLSSIFSDSSVDGYLAQNPKLYPALFRYRFDPNTNVRNSMNEIWTALVRDPTATIDQHFDTIMRDLLRNILGKEWRTREACCAAIADLVQSRSATKYEKYIGEIWTLTFKVSSSTPPDLILWQCLTRTQVCDDIKESVRNAAMALARVLVGILTRGLEAGDSSTRSAGAMLENVLPFLLSPSGLESSAQDVQAFSLSALLQIIKKSNKAILRPFVPDLVCRLILLLSSLEPEGIEYIRLRAEQYGVTGQQIDDARLSGVRGSPMLEAIERCLDFLDESSMQELRGPLENAVTTGLGLPSRVGGSRVLVSLSTRHNYLFRPHANHFIRLARKQVLDRNDTISASYSAACGYLARLASDEEILELIDYSRKLYFDSDDERHRLVAGEIVLTMSKHATDRFNALAAEILPFVFFAKHDSYERAKTVFQDTWNETVGGSRVVLLYMREIIQLALQYLNSPRWSLKHTAAFTVADALNATGDDISDSNAQIIWPGVERAVDGKTWEGKEKILQAFVKFVRAKNTVTDNKGTQAQIQKIMLRESKRNNLVYRQHALACLADYLELRESVQLATEVYGITAPIIEESLAGSDEMDHDRQPGGHASKTMNDETLANAQAALLRSINPHGQTNEDLCSSLSRGLALTVRTLSGNGSRKVHNAIFEAEKSLFEKLQRTLRPPVSELLVTVLIDFARTLFGTRDQVEQTRTKAAEAAAAFAPLTKVNGRLREALIDGIGSARTQERSVTVQQSLDRARQAIPDE
ncbi:MAG: hypothetical protein Q9225_004830 [Loekoesia sp. 1 TL-2023]